MTAHVLVPATTPELWTALHEIRRAELFTPGRHRVDFEYDANHPDDLNAANTPFVMLYEGIPIGTVRLDTDGDGIGIMRLVAIAELYQRSGHGRVLMDKFENEARRRGITMLYVNAAPGAVGWYEKLGWRSALWDATELQGLAADCTQMVKPLV